MEKTSGANIIYGRASEKSANDYQTVGTPEPLKQAERVVRPTHANVGKPEDLTAGMPKNAAEAEKMRQQAYRKSATDINTETRGNAERVDAAGKRARKSTQPEDSGDKKPR